MTALPGHVTLFPHQRKAVDKLGNGKVLCGDVGVGKTFTALAYWQEHEAPRDIYVLTTAKKRDDLDWEEAAAPFSVSAHKGLGVANITVDSWNNIKKYQDVKDAFFILDEQRLVGTGAWTKAFYKIAKANHWIMLSATPGDVWLDYAPLFIANGWYRNITDFRDQHVIYSYRRKFPQVERYVGTPRLMRQREAVLVEMPYLRHTTRHIEDICVDYDRDLFDLVVKKRWHPLEDRPIRDVAELFHVMRRVAYSDDSRVESVRTLLQKHPKLIVFYNFNFELEKLRELGEELKAEWVLTRNDTTTPKLDGTPNGGSKASSSTASTSHPSDSSESGTSSGVFTYQEWNGQKHEPIPTTDSWLYLVQYTAGAEGWNCVETDAMAFYSLNYSYKITHQAMGRIDRLNTPYTDLYYYRLVSKSMIDKAVAGALKEKKKFNENAFASNTHLKFPTQSVKNGH